MNSPKNLIQIPIKYGVGEDKSDFVTVDELL